MSILESVVPGLRDVRSALVAGYLWLVVLWIAAHDEVHEVASDSIKIQAVLDLANAAGRIWIALAASFAAYVVGVLSQDASHGLSVGIRQLGQMAERTLDAFEASISPSSSNTTPGEDDDAPTPRRGVTAIKNALAHLRRAFSDGVLDLESAELDPFTGEFVDARVNGARGRVRRRLRAEATDDDQRALWNRRLDGLVRQLRAELHRELQFPATLLVGDRPELYAEADRLRAEADLRLTVAPPLVVLVTVLASEFSTQWVWATLPAFYLFVQGMRREDDLKRLIAAAFMQGLAKSSAIARFDAEIERFEAEVGKVELTTLARPHTQ